MLILAPSTLHAISSTANGPKRDTFRCAPNFSKDKHAITIRIEAVAMFLIIFGAQMNNFLVIKVNILSFSE